MISDYPGPFKFQRALAASALPAHARLVALMLAMHAGHDTGGCYPSIATLVTSCGLSKSSIIRALAVLEREGWIQVTREANKANRYTLKVVSHRHHCTAFSGATQTPGLSHSETRVVSHRHQGSVTVTPEQTKEPTIEKTKEQEPPESPSSEVYIRDARAIADSGEGGLLEYFNSAPKQDTSHAEVSASERIRARWCAVYEGNPPGELDRLVERFGVSAVEDTLDDVFEKALRSPVRYLRAALMSRQGQAKRSPLRASGALPF